MANAVVWYLHTCYFFPKTPSLAALARSFCENKLTRM